MAKQLQADREAFEAKRGELENRCRAVDEAELLLKNQRMLHQKQMSQLMEQKDLVELRAKLEQQEDDLREKEAFLSETEKRLGKQLAARELDLSRREAWVSAEHEKAAQKHARRLQAVVFTDVVGFSGGSVTAASFGIVDTDGRWVVENEGVAPDVEVFDTPKDCAACRDAQLEKAIELAMGALEKHPPKKPPAYAPPVPR